MGVLTSLVFQNSFDSRISSPQHHINFWGKTAMHCVGIGKAATNGAPNSENSGNFLAMKMKSDHHPTFTTTPICDLALSDGGSLDALRAVLQPLQQNGAKSVGFSLRPGSLPSSPHALERLA